MMRFIWRLVGNYLLLRVLAMIGGRWMRGGSLLRGLPWLMSRTGGRSRLMRGVAEALGWLALSRMRARRT
jgi:hypothetical protein